MFSLGNPCVAACRIVLKYHERLQVYIGSIASGTMHRNPDVHFNPHDKASIGNPMLLKNRDGPGPFNTPDGEIPGPLYLPDVW
jgi:hypothetical protein